MTESLQQTTTIDELREAQHSAEAQAAEMRSQLRALEAELRQLHLNAGLSDEQRYAERRRIKAAHQEVVARQRMMEVWTSRLRDGIDRFERRTAQPRRELRDAEARLATIDERLAALSRQTQELQGEREAMQLRRDTAQAAIDALMPELPEQPQYAPPARTITQIGAFPVYLDAQGNQVHQDGSPIEKA